MNYAIWKLNFLDPNYGTGPEDYISNLGFYAEAAWNNDEVEDGGTILGYVNGIVETTPLAIYEFSYITQSEALDFALQIDSSAYLLENGRITVPAEI